MPITCLYIVISSRQKWWVDCEGKAFGPFPTREMAEKAAVELARLYGDLSRPLEVLTKTESGLYHLLWSSEAEGPFSQAA